MKVFKLPDLGEGLPDAEIVEWLVQEGDEVKLDQPLVSMETAKAVVEVPSPFSGKVTKFHGQAGDVIQTGAPLAEFQVEGESDSSAEPASESGATEPQAAAEPHTTRAEPSPEPSARDEVEDITPAEAPVTETAPSDERADTGTVVGNVQSSNEVLQERTSSFGGVKATPAVRALARKMKVDLSRLEATGAEGVITVSDVRRAAESGAAPAEPRTRSAQSMSKPESRPPSRADVSPQSAPSPAAASGAGSGKHDGPSDEWLPVRGTRRTMARVMSESHKSVVPTTLMDDADIHAWRPGEDITARLLRALWAGAQAEPGLNAWFDGDNSVRMIHKNMHVGMAVDTPDGLFVAALRNVNKSDHQQLRNEINRLRENASNRSIPPEDLKDYTIVLSNFGKFAGRYATPVITPPCVSIIAAGKLRHEVVPVLGGIEVHRMIPLSLTFDHRACTGGEAARFLKAMLDDLAQAE